MKLESSAKCPAEYQVLREASSGKCGIIGKSGDGGLLAVAPVYRNRKSVEAFVAVLNRLQVPVSDFLDVFLIYEYTLR